MSENNKSIAAKYRKRESALRSSYRRKMTLLTIIALIVGLVVGCVGGVHYQKYVKDAKAAETSKEAVETAAETADGTDAQDDEFENMFDEEGETESEGDVFDPFGASAEEAGNAEEFPAEEGGSDEEADAGEDIFGGDWEEGEPEEETGALDEGETETDEEPAEEEPAEEEGEPEAGIMGENGVDLFNPVGAGDDEGEEEPAEEEPAADEEPAEEEPDDGNPFGEEPAADEEPAEEELPEPEIEAVFMNEDAVFTVWVTPDGAMYEGEGEYIEIPVTVKVLRHMDTDYYIGKYINEYQLKGDEACVEMNVAIGDVDGVESVLAQNIMITQLEDEDGTVIPGYQFKDAEIGGVTDSTIQTGGSKNVYKRYSSDLEKQPVYLTVEYFNEGLNKLYFCFEEAPEKPVEVTYKLGDKNDGVRTLQEALIKLGYLEGEADGDFGVRTEAAVRSAQIAYGFETTGIADEKLMNRLLADAQIEAPAPETAEEPENGSEGEPEATEEPAVTGLKKGDKGDEVKKMQSALIKLGYLQGEPDGSFGAYTEDALKRAQGALGFDRTGVADEAFLKALYEKAGME